MEERVLMSWENNRKKLKTAISEEKNDRTFFIINKICRFSDLRRLMNYTLKTCSEIHQSPSWKNIEYKNKPSKSEMHL